MKIMNDISNALIVLQIERFTISGAETVQFDATTVKTSLCYKFE